MWGISDCFDGYEYGNLNQGAAFLFILMHKYGKDVHDIAFYTKKYLLACYNLYWVHPNDVDEVTPALHRPIYIRLFKRFMIYFGILTISNDKYDFVSKYEKAEIEVTSLLYELIEVDPPENKVENKTDIRFS